MNAMQCEILRLIAKETARLTQVVEAAALAAQSAEKRAGKARMLYQAAPSEANGAAMDEAAKIAGDAYADACEANEALETAHAARAFLITAVKDEEREKRSPG